MNLSRGQAGYNSSHSEQYKFTMIPVENHNVIVPHSKLVSKRARVLLVRKQALQHLRTVRIYILQCTKETSKQQERIGFWMTITFHSFSVELTKIKLRCIS